MENKETTLSEQFQDLQLVECGQYSGRRSHRKIIETEVDWLYGV